MASQTVPVIVGLVQTRRTQERRQRLAIFIDFHTVNYHDHMAEHDHDFGCVLERANPGESHV